MKAHRVAVFLGRQEIEALDRIALDCLFTVGKRLPKATILGSFASLLTKINMSGEWVTSPEELLERVYQAWHKAHERASDKGTRNPQQKIQNFPDEHRADESGERETRGIPRKTSTHLQTDS